jgi:uncharacterized membrane protein
MQLVSANLKQENTRRISGESDAVSIGSSLMSRNETGRIEAFSDGVIGIAATLLILEVKVPPLSTIHSSAELWQALLQLWPSYFAFAYSFGTVFVAWVNHHETFKWIVKPSRAFVYANGLLLLTVTVLPFPTALLAQYLTTEYAQPAITFFCACSVLHNAGWLVFAECIHRSPALLKPEGRAQAVFSRKALWIGASVYAATTVLSIWFPVTALAINSSLWVLWIVTSFSTRTVQDFK